MSAKQINPIGKFSTLKARAVAGIRNSPLAIKFATDGLSVTNSSGQVVADINGVDTTSVIPTVPGADANNSFVLSRGTSHAALTTNCTFLGYSTGTGGPITGQNNTLVGGYAGYAVTTGAGNTLVGHNSGISVTTGAGNVCVGTTTGVTLTTGSNNVSIGYITTVDPAASYTVTLGSGTRAMDTGSVAIGAYTEAPHNVALSTPIPVCAIGRTDPAPFYPLAIRESAYAHTYYNEETIDATPGANHDLTPEEALKGIITITADPGVSHTTLTLPTFAALYAVLPGVYAGHCFDLMVVNDGAAAADTLSVTPITDVVGDPVIPGITAGAATVRYMRFLFTGATLRGTPTGYTVFIKP